MFTYWLVFSVFASQRLGALRLSVHRWAILVPYAVGLQIIVYEKDFN